MSDGLTNFHACYEVLRAQPLSLYEDDPACDSPIIRRRIGEIIAEAMNQSLKRGW